MCGIYGEVSIGAAPERRERFARHAAHALRHRGPDGEGTWSDASCQLGHLRLSILDLSTNAAQPMASASGQSHLAFNGEIYNYVELRDRFPLPEGGYRSSSDTEVLVELLDRRGLEGLRDAVGMFAFAWWRPEQRELVLVRDRLGKKPLYWARTRDGAVRFASELGALLADGEVPRETTRARLAEFLQLGYVAAPRTGLSTVHAVPPGCVLRVRVDGGRVTTSLERWWSLPSVEEAPRFDGVLEFHERFLATLRDAVRLRLRSDVPLGAFLSGGVDSSVTSLLAAEQLPNKLRTFTIDFAESGWSEGPFAEEVARHVGAEHTSIVLSSDALASLPELARLYGDLHGDSSSIPTVALCRAAREHVTVAIAGDGGDELLGGYTRYASALRTTELAARVPSPLLAVARSAARTRLLAMARGASRLARLSGDLGAYYAREMRAYQASDVPEVLIGARGLSFDDPVSAALAANARRSPLQRLMATDLATYLPEDILVKVDRASMAVGLEVRAPLLDHRLMELVSGADPAWLAGPEGGKRPLRQLFASRLPRAVFERQKMGFGVPLARWLRERADHTEPLLDARAPVADALDRSAVKRMLAAHRAGLSDESLRLFRLLVLAAWFELWKPAIAR